jgi:hypothetical protein
MKNRKIKYLIGGIVVIVIDLFIATLVASPALTNTGRAILGLTRIALIKGIGLE